VIDSTGPGGSPERPTERREAPQPPLPPPVRRLLYLGLVAFVPIVVLIRALGGVGILDALMIAVLLQLLPVLAVVQLPLVETADLRRSDIYRGSVVSVALLAGAALLLGVRRGGWVGVGLGRPPLASDLLWGVGVAAAILMLLVGLAAWRRRVGLREEPMVAELMPRTRRERWAFLALSVSAGLGEEIVYRGYAIPVLTLMTDDLWMAVLVSSGAFGLVHVYQGGLGIARTGFIGLVLALTFLGTGSLWAPVIAHTLADIGVGFWLADRLLD
jgi:membrane protease YdiL (CAAX protease family)